ncbi:unnamed protein product, partial [Amoebophrya sp. A25]
NPPDAALNPTSNSVPAPVEEIIFDNEDSTELQLARQTIDRIAGFQGVNEGDHISHSHIVQEAVSGIVGRGVKEHVDVVNSLADVVALREDEPPPSQISGSKSPPNPTLNPDSLESTDERKANAGMHSRTGAVAWASPSTCSSTAALQLHGGLLPPSSDDHKGAGSHTPEKNALASDAAQEQLWVLNVGEQMSGVTVATIVDTSTSGRDTTDANSD